MGARVIDSFLDPGEVAEQRQLWETCRPGGWRATRRGAEVYTFAPCPDPPVVLLTRALAEMPADRAAPFVDSFFIHYRDGDAAPPHLDERSGMRLNVCLVAPESGGLFLTRSSRVALRAGDAVVFSPAREIHRVTRVHGERLIWSVGRTVNPPQTRAR